MLVLSLIVFLFTLLAVFGAEARENYDNQPGSRHWGNAFRTLSTLAGIFVGLTLVYDNRYNLLTNSYGNRPSSISTLAIHELWLLYLIAGFVCGFIAFLCALGLRNQGASVGSKLRDGGPRRVSKYTLFDEAANRLRTMGEQEPVEATRFASQLFNALPGEVQFKALEGAYGSDWTEPLAKAIAELLRGELAWLVTGEGERPTAQDSSRRQQDPMKRLGAQLLPLLVQHPLIADALREHKSSLDEQAPLLRQEMDNLARTHNAYVRKDEELRGITRRLQAISDLLGDGGPEEPGEQ